MYLLKYTHMSPFLYIYSFLLLLLHFLLDERETYFQIFCTNRKSDNKVDFNFENLRNIFKATKKMKINVPLSVDKLIPRYGS